LPHAESRFGTYSVTESINAGLDLEMPGPPRWRQKALLRQSVNAHKTSWETIDQRLVTLLTWVQTLAKMNPDLVFNEPPERTRWECQAADAALVRRIGTDGIVLLKNEGVLPIQRGSVAVIGPNAKADVVTGGGSARLRPAWVVTPWEGMEQCKPAEVSLTYSLGCKGAKFLPVFGPEFTAADGNSGFDLLHFAIVDGKQAAEPTVKDRWANSDLILYDFYHPDLGAHYFTEIRATFTAPITGTWEFEASVTGQGWLFIDDVMVLDISKEQKRTSSFFGNGTEGTIVQINVQEGRVSDGKVAY
jgi:beta-glucosidase